MKNKVSAQERELKRDERRRRNKEGNEREAIRREATETCWRGRDTRVQVQTFLIHFLNGQHLLK